MRRIITAPTALVVTVDEAKEFGPIGLDCTDDIVESLIRVQLPISKTDYGTAPY